MADAKIRLSVDGSAQVVTDLSRVERGISALDSVTAKAKQSLSLLGVGLGINEIARLSDEYTKYTAQLKLATRGEAEYASARASVSKIAQQAQSDLASTGLLYARVANGTRELGLSQQKVGEITESVMLSLKASGATQQETASATLQLSQAFASGTLRGEEFNAVNEASPRLMKALADGLGVPVGALKQMATEGKITSEVMANTLPKALEELRKEAAQVQTISGAYTNLQNSVLELVGTQAQSNGTAAILSTTINTLANNLNLVSAAAAGFTAVKVSEKIIDMVVNTRASIVASSELAAVKARETAATIAAAQANVTDTTAKVTHLVETRAAIISAREETAAKLASANASIVAAQAQVQAATSAGALSAALAAVRQGEINLTIAMQARAVATTELAVLGQQQAAVSAQVAAATAAQAAAQTGLATASTAAAAGTSLLSRALGFLGGPIGIITTLLGVGVTAWMAWGSASKSSEEKASASVEASTADIVAGLDAQIEKLNERNSLAASGLEKIAKSESAAAQKLASLKAKMLAAQTGQGEYANLNEVARIDILRKLGEQYGTLYGKIEAANEAQRKLDASGKAATDVIEVRERLLGVNKQYLDDLTKLQTAYEKGAIAPKEYVDLLGRLAVKTYEASKAGKDAAKSVADQGISYDSVMKSLNEKISVLNLDISTEKDLTEAQKVAMKLMTDIGTVRNTLTDKEKQAIGVSLELYLAKDKLNEQSKVEKKLAEERANAHKSYISAVDSDIATLNEQIAAQREHNMRLGLSKDAILALDLAKLEDLALSREMAAADMMLAGSSEDVAERYLTEAARLRELIALRKNGAGLQAELDIVNTRISEQQDVWNMVERTAHDTWVSITNGGKDVATRLRDTFKNTFFDYLYQMTIKKWFINVTAGVSASASGMAQASGVGESINPSSALSAGKTLWESFSAGFSGFGDKVASFVQSGLDKAGFHQTTMSASGNGAFASGAGTVASYGAGIAAGVYGGRAISAGYSAGEHGNALVNVGTLAGAIFGGPLGAAIGGAIAGGVNRAFGMREKELGGQTVTGTLGSQDLMRNQSWSQSGGLFRSDRSGVWSYRLSDSTAIQDGKAYTDTASLAGDKALMQGLNDGYSAIKAASTDFAKALGLNADVIEKRVDQLNLTLGKTQEERDKAISQAFGSIADAIAQDLLPEINKLSKDGESASTTLARLAGSLNGVNNIMETLGSDKFASSIDGASAAQRLIDVAGGIDKFSASAAFFAENFFSETEKLAPTVKLVTEKMSELGLANVTTVEQFKKVTLGLDRNTEAGATLFVQLMQLAPAFKAVAEAGSSISGVETARVALESASQTYKNAMQAVTSGLGDLSNKVLAAKQNELNIQQKISAAFFSAQEAVASVVARIDDLKRQSRDFLRSSSDSIKQYLSSMGSNATEQSASSLRKSLLGLADQAKKDPAAQEKLLAAAQQFLAASNASSETTSAYNRDEAFVRNLLSGVASELDKQASAIQVSDIVDPMVSAQTELIAANKRLADLTALAAATDANMDRSMVIVADSTTALLAEYKQAHDDRVKAQADYSIAQQLVIGLGATASTSQSGFAALIDEAVKAKTAMASAQADLSTAVIKAANGSQKSVDDFAKLLGLTGDEAALLKKAITEANLSTDGYRSLMSATGLSAIDLAKTLTISNTTAAELSGRLSGVSGGAVDLQDALAGAKVSASGFKALISATGLTAEDLAKTLARSDTTAAELSLRLAGVSGGSVELRATLAGTDLNAQNLSAVLAGAHLTVGDFNDLVSATGLSAEAVTAALGTDDQGLRRAVVVSGATLLDFVDQAHAAGLTVGQFNKLLGDNGLTSTSWVGLQKLTNSDSALLAEYLNMGARDAEGLAEQFVGVKASSAAIMERMNQFVLPTVSLDFSNLQASANAMAALMSQFKLPNLGESTSDQSGASGSAGSAGAVKSLNQQIVESWYQNNPYANKANDPFGIAYWISDIEKSGMLNAKRAFADSVAQLTGTAPVDIQKFATGAMFDRGIVSKPTNFSIGQMGEAGPETILPLRNVGGRMGVSAIGQDDRLLRELIEQVRILQQQLSSIDSNTEQTSNNTYDTSRTLSKVSEGGDAFKTVGVTA